MHMTVAEFADKLGIEVSCDFHPGILVPEVRIRAFCEQNKCGNYGRNYMCPPHIGPLEEIRAKLKNYQRGVLLQYIKSVDVRGDRKGVIQTKIDFHGKILRIEEFLREQGISQVWGLSGGNCGLCKICHADKGKPCRHPDRARPSLEAVGIDVLKLLEYFGLDSGFHADKITWTGCILMEEGKNVLSESQI